MQIIVKLTIGMMLNEKNLYIFLNNKLYCKSILLKIQHILLYL